MQSRRGDACDNSPPTGPQPRRGRPVTQRGHVIVWRVHIAEDRPVPATQFELGQLTLGDRLAADEHVLHGENLPSATDTLAKCTLASRSTSRELANVRLAEIQELRPSRGGLPTPGQA